MMNFEERSISGKKFVDEIGYTCELRSIAVSM